MLPARDETTLKRDTSSAPSGSNPPHLYLHSSNNSLNKTLEYQQIQEDIQEMQMEILMNKFEAHEMHLNKKKYARGYFKWNNRREEPHVQQQGTSKATLQVNLVQEKCDLHTLAQIAANISQDRKPIGAPPNKSVLQVQRTCDLRTLANIAAAHHIPQVESAPSPSPVIPESLPLKKRKRDVSVEVVEEYKSISNVSSSNDSGSTRDFDEIQFLGEFRPTSVQSCSSPHNNNNLLHVGSSSSVASDEICEQEQIKTHQPQFHKSGVKEVPPYLNLKYEESGSSPLFSDNSATWFHQANQHFSARPIINYKSREEEAAPPTRDFPLDEDYKEEGVVYSPHSPLGSPPPTQLQSTRDLTQNPALPSSSAPHVLPIYDKNDPRSPEFRHWLEEYYPTRFTARHPNTLFEQLGLANPLEEGQLYPPWIAEATDFQRWNVSAIKRNCLPSTSSTLPSSIVLGNLPVKEERRERRWQKSKVTTPHTPCITRGGGATNSSTLLNCTVVRGGAFRDNVIPSPQPAPIDLSGQPNTQAQH